MYKTPSYLFFYFLVFACTIRAQLPTLQDLSDNVLRLSGADERQDRHIAINDSFHREKAYKTQWNYLDLIQKDCRRTRNKSLEAIVINSKGNFYLGTGNYTSGIETFNEGVRIFDSLNDHAGLSMIRAILAMLISM